jgi:GT2 family glycosyltransferase
MSTTPTASGQWTYSPGFIAEPLVSALVPVYGAERFMRGLLEDLEAQTLADRTEIVIVDTGSPTGEAAIVREFQARYSNIAYLRTPERETTAAACNRCIAAARSRYVALACADDRHHPDAHARMVAALEAHPEVAMVYGDSAVTERENEPFGTPHVSAHFRWPEFDPRLLFQVCYLGPQPMWRRALHERHGLFDPTYVSASDYEFWLRLAAGGERFLHISEVLGLYLWSPTSVEHANQQLSLADSERARVQHWPPAWGPRPAPGGSFLIPCEPAGSEVAAAPDAAPPLVSVIVPTCDRPAWLTRALESVLRQTYRHVEIIVVNDAGMDVREVINPLRERADIAYVQLSHSRERSAARNAGIAIARGKYLAYLDDDDWYYPRHLETLVTALEQSGAAVAYTDAWRVSEASQGTTYVVEAIDRPYSADFDRERLVIENYIPILCVMHRRDCLDRVGGFDEQLQTHEDWDLFIRLARAYDFLHVPQVTCAFSWRTDGSSTTSRMRADFARTTALIHQRYLTASHDPAAPEMPPRSADELRAQLAGCQFLCSIVVPVSDGVERTAQCLGALAQHTSDVDYEVIVVDDASRDGTAAFLATLGGDLQIIRNAEPLGRAHAANQGAEVARGRFLVFLHPDTIPRQHWLTALVADVAAHPDVAAVGSKLLYPDGTIQHAGLVFSRLSGEPYHLYQRAPGDVVVANRRRELQALSAASLLVRREVFETVGGFDARFGNVLHDVDLCLRIRARGGRVVYQPASVLVRVEDSAPSTDAPGKSAPARGEAPSPTLPSPEEARSLALLGERWAHRCLEDEDVVYASDGHVLSTDWSEDAESCRLVPLATAPDQAGWARLVEAERRTLAGGAAAAASLLADARAWPADVGALAWGAHLCERAHLPGLAAAFWRRVLALAELPGARLHLATLEREESNAGVDYENARSMNQ